MAELLEMWRIAARQVGLSDEARRDAEEVVAALERIPELERELADARESIAWRADWIKSAGPRLERAERVEAAARPFVVCEVAGPLESRPRCGSCDGCKLRAALGAALWTCAECGYRNSTSICTHCGAAPAPEEVKPCPTCDGCGQVADTDDQEPWTAWANLPLGPDAAVRMGLVRPIPCPVCAAPAEKGRAPYELRKGGIGHNEVVPAIVVMTPDGLRIAEEGDGGR